MQPLISVSHHSTESTGRDCKDPTESLAAPLRISGLSGLYLVIGTMVTKGKLKQMTTKQFRLKIRAK